jgi:phosphopantetheine--protein transferase-like protein
MTLGYSNIGSLLSPFSDFYPEISLAPGGMRIPFSLDLTVGTDIIFCKRILDWTRPEEPAQLTRLVKRVLHDREIRILDKRFSWWRSNSTKPQEERRRLSLWLGGRWAAKEAAKKAWGAHLLSWRDVVVENSADGSPQMICQVAGQMGQGIAEQVARLSISHDEDYAIATVLATPLHSGILAELSRRMAEAELKVGKTHGQLE